MGIRFSRAFLMSGADFRLTPSLTLHHPTVGEALSIDGSPEPDSTYWEYVQLLLSDPYANMVMLDDMGKDYLMTSPYEVFAMQWDIRKEEYMRDREAYDAHGTGPLRDITCALRLFTTGMHRPEKGAYGDGSVCFYDVDDPSCQINEETFRCLHEWVRAVNRIDYSGRINPADENARRVLIEDMRDGIRKARRRGKKESGGADYLGGVMSAVSFCGNGSITPFNIGDCKLYWLTEALSISTRKDNAGHLLDGIYHGTLSPKDIDRKEIDWVKQPGLF